MMRTILTLQRRRFTAQNEGTIVPLASSTGGKVKSALKAGAAEFASGVIHTTALILTFVGIGSGMVYFGCEGFTINTRTPSKKEEVSEK
jgi:hypothetical protein